MSLPTHQYTIYVTYKSSNIIYTGSRRSWKELGGVTTIKPKHVLSAGGIVLVIIGHLGDGTATREVAFWLGVLLSFVGLGLELRDESFPQTPG
jgi:hypothetical protein